MSVIGTWTTVISLLPVQTLWEVMTAHALLVLRDLGFFKTAAVSFKALFCFTVITHYQLR